MDFFFAVNIFLIIFTLAECHGYYPYTSTKMDKCKKLVKLASETMLTTRCTPRSQLVELKPDPGYKFNPPMVAINTCKGHCPGTICEPTEFKNVERVVTKIKRRNPKSPVCVVVKLQEHTKCSCQCKKRPEDCLHNQEYDDQECSCKCKDKERLMQECEREPGMKWFEDFCGCKCVMKVLDCTNGLNWDPTTCKCK